jgi:hypothetical protein
MDSYLDPLFRTEDLKGVCVCVCVLELLGKLKVRFLYWSGQNHGRAPRWCLGSRMDVIVRFATTGMGKAWSLSLDGGEDSHSL